MRGARIIVLILRHDLLQGIISMTPRKIPFNRFFHNFVQNKRLIKQIRHNSSKPKRLTTTTTTTNPHRKKRKEELIKA